MSLGTQEALIEGHEGSHLLDAVWGELVELHPIMVQHAPEEEVRWHPKPAHVVSDEAHHIPRWRRRRSLDPWKPPFLHLGPRREEASLG